MIYLAILLAVVPSFWAWIRLDSILDRRSLAIRGSAYERALLRQFVAVVGWWEIGVGLALILSGAAGIVLLAGGAVLVAYAVGVKVAAAHGAAL